MPAGTIVGQGRHDPFGPVPDGIPINVKVTVDHEQGMIKLDLEDNIDCLPAGVNESRTCAMNNVMTGLFNSIDPDIPHNSGTFRRVRVKLRENCVVGIPRFPHSCSVGRPTSASAWSSRTSGRSPMRGPATASQRAHAESAPASPSSRVPTGAGTASRT